ncbi:phosphate ABC transporter permease PstA [Halorutilales archaeon Cl-col2-1]
MAAQDTDTGVEGIRNAKESRLRRIRDGVFEAVLLFATLIGILSLVVLFGYIGFDAFRPLTASARWYLLYFGVLVAPTAAFTVYARRHPKVRSTNAMSFGVFFGSLTVALVTYVVADAVSPYDILVYLVFGGVPPALVILYGRTRGDRRYTGPAVPVSVIVGVGVAAGLYDFVRPVVGIAAEWIAYFGIVTVPAALLLGGIGSRRKSRRHGLRTSASVAIGALTVAGGLLVTGTNPSFWVVIFSSFVAPVAYFVLTAVRDEGKTGVLGPFIVVGGVLVGAYLERLLGIQGLEGYLTPTLLLSSWNGLSASEAGVYPQIVGSIVIVGFMSVLAFPIGVGAAVYLEEYAPNSGWRGRLATVLEVNISNLAGVPSVVYGLLGLALFRNTLSFGTGVVVSASGTLALLILPIVVVSSQEAIRSVPDSVRQASYGIGASRWQTLRNVVLPEAIPGILTGTILALARAIGETAPLVIISVATTTYSPPEGLFSSATALPLQIFAARSNVDAAFRHGIVPATAVVLLVLMLVMNATAVVIRNRYERE